MGEKFEKINSRTMTIVIGLPIVWLIIHLGGIVYYIGIMLIALLSFWELWIIVKQQNYCLSLVLGTVLILFLLFPRYVSELFSNPRLVFTILFFLISLEHFLNKPQKHSIINIALTIFIAIYVGHLLSFFIEIRELSNGKNLLFFSLLTTWVNDVMAYLIGVNFGKKHPFPYISPNKTLEGALGGLLGGGLCALAFCSVIPLKISLLFFLGLAAALFGQIGDLFESLIKRNFGAKDSGSLLPGLSGILDCIDSCLFSVPILYYTFLVLL